MNRVFGIAVLSGLAACGVENLPPMEDMQYLEVHFPWNRMFEARFAIEPPFNFKAYMEEHRAE